MNDQEIRIAIAEACGWRRMPEFDYMSVESSPDYVEMWGRVTGQLIPLRMLPDYPNDLNAMHEAEKVLTDEQRWKQACIIVNWHSAPSGFPLFSRSEVILLSRATARQRAEAFLRTIGKWKD